jgi:hypothetical protein
VERNQKASQMFERKVWMRELAAKGDWSTSQKKQAASRAKT